MLRARLLIIAGLFLLALWFVRLGYLGWALWRDAHTTQALLASDPQQNSVLLIELIHNLRQESGALQLETWPLMQVLPLARPVPYIGSTLASLPPTLNLVADLSLAADESLQTLQPVITRAPDVAPLAALLFSTQSRRASLQTAQQAATNALRDRQAIPSDAPDFIMSRIQQLDPYLPLLQQATVVLAASPELLGGNGPRTYLFLIQNSDELRATGGFISSVGILRFNNGDYTFEVQNSYALDDFPHQAYPPPPAPLHNYMGADLWLLRDSNWSPDFPTAARDVAGLYHLGQGEAVSGVVAFDQLALKYLLQAIGPVTLNDGSGLVNASGLDQFLHDQWKPEPSNLDPSVRSYSGGFMGGLAESFFTQLDQDSSSLNVSALLKAGQQILNEKHALIFTADPNLSNLLATQGWDGALAPGDQDYLYVVDSNVGFNKANALLRRTINYQVDLTDPFHPQADLSVQYQLTGQSSLSCNQLDNAYGKGGYDALTQGCYWNYLRVYAPGESTLINGQLHPTSRDWLWNNQYADGLVTIASGESDTTLFDQFFVVPAGGQLNAHITYTLPPKIVKYTTTSATYCVHFEKQPGTQSDALQVQIALPSGALLQSSTPTPTIELDGVATYQLNLQTDQHLCLTFPR